MYLKTVNQLLDYFSENYFEKKVKTEALDKLYQDLQALKHKTGGLTKVLNSKSIIKRINDCEDIYIKEKKKRIGNP